MNWRENHRRARDVTEREANVLNRMFNHVHEQTRSLRSGQEKVHSIPNKTLQASANRAQSIASPWPPVYARR